MTKPLSELINEHISLGNEIDVRIRNGIATIDRILWDTGVEDWEIPDVVPEKFYINNYSLKNGKIRISWYTVFRTETDQSGTFDIPEIYFNDPDAYEEDLKAARKAKEERETRALADKEQEEAVVLAMQKFNQARLLEELLAARERGEI